MSLSIESPAPVLWQSLVRGGFGALAGREWQGVRSTLGAIIACSRAGSVETTVWQVAQSAGLSEKWTSRCMAILEALGVIRWYRGEIQNGRPLPGIVQIIKARLLELVREAWNRSSRKWAARRVETAKRLALLKNKKANIRRSGRTELSGYLNCLFLSPSGGEREINQGEPPDFARPGWQPVENSSVQSSVQSDASPDPWFTAHPIPEKSGWEWCREYIRYRQENKE